MRNIQKNLSLLFISMISVFVFMQPMIPAAEKNISKTPEAGNTSGNIANGGGFAEKDGWLYFSDQRNFGALTKCRADGSEMTVLTEDAGFSINVVGEWVYYSIYAQGFSIRKIKTDGTGKKELRMQRSFNLTVYGDWIYFTDTDLYRMKTDGSQHEMLEPDVTFPDDSWTHTGTIAISDGWIFFQNYNENALYRMKLDGSQRSCVNAEVAPWSLQVFNGHLYYTDYFAVSLSSDSGIFRSELDGTKKTFIPIELPQVESIWEEGEYVDDNIWRFNVTKDYIYIIAELGESVYRCDLQGKGLTKVSDIATGAVCSLSQGMAFTSERRAKYRITPQGNDTLFESERFSDPGTILKEIDGWVYFIKKSDDNWENELFRVRPDGSDLKKLTNEKVLANKHSLHSHTELVMIDEKAQYIYYLHESGIRRIPLEGGTPETVLATKRASSIVAMHDNWVYYLSSTNVFRRMRVDGSEKQTLSNEPISYFNINVDGHVLYGQFDYEKDKNTTTRMFVISENGLFVEIPSSMQYADTVDNIVIYSGYSNTLFHVDESKTATSVTIDGDVQDFSHGWVYFLRGEKLYRSWYDGTQEEYLIDNVQGFYESTDKYVFYIRSGGIAQAELYRLNLKSKKSSFVGIRPESNYGYLCEVINDQFYFWGIKSEHHLIDHTNGKATTLFAAKPTLAS